MGIYSMAISQSEHDKFSWGRISAQYRSFCYCKLNIRAVVTLIGKVLLKMQPSTIHCHGNTDVMIAEITNWLNEISRKGKKLAGDRGSLEKSNSCFSFFSVNETRN